jgi:hypothetical protein
MILEEENKLINMTKNVNMNISHNRHIISENLMVKKDKIMVNLNKELAKGIMNN